MLVRLLSALAWKAETNAILRLVSAQEKKITIENLVFADVFLSERLVSSEFAFGKTTLVFFLQVKSTHICCNSIGKEKEKINNVFFLVCVCPRDFPEWFPPTGVLKQWLIAWMTERLKIALLPMLPNAAVGQSAYNSSSRNFEIHQEIFQRSFSMHFPWIRRRRRRRCCCATFRSKSFLSPAALVINFEKIHSWLSATFPFFSLHCKV